MPVETVYADLVLAVAALIAGALYLRARRRHVTHKKSGPPVRPATPTPQAAMPARGAVTTWAPPPPPTPGPRPFWGGAAAGRAPCASGGFACAGALVFGAASPALVGCAEARGSATGGPASRAVMGSACRSIVGRASDHRQAIRRRVV